MFKDSLRLFKNDCQQIIHNKFTLIIIIGLMLLPSFYAWFNIWALQDPYGNASNLPIAVLNEDKGTKVNGEAINVGDEIIANLHQNSELSWQFPKDRAEVDEKVNTGDYYGAIIIPTNFSSKLTGFTEDKYQKPKLEYIVNEKVNAIAPKMTEAGAEGIYSEVTSNFNTVIASVMLEIGNEIGLDLKAHQSELNTSLDDLNKLNNKLPNLVQELNKIEIAQSKITGINNQIPTIEDEFNQKQDKLISAINVAYTQIDDITINQQLVDKLIATEQKYNEFATKLNEINISQEDITKLNTEVNSLVSSAKDVNEKVNSLDANQISEAADKLTVISSKLNKIGLDDEAAALNSISSKLTSVSEVLITAQNKELNFNVDTAKISSAQQIIIQLSNEQLPTLNITNKIDVEGLKSSKQQVLEMLDKAKFAVSEIDSSILDDVSADLDLVTSKLDDLAYVRDNQVLPAVNKVDEITIALNEVRDSGDYDKLVSALSFDVDIVSDFLANPVEMETTRLYPVENYGMASTPFYTSLCLWVGGLLLASMLSFESHKLKISNRSIYLGRMYTFVTIGIVQALIVSLGDVYILGIIPSDFKLFILTNIFVAVVFDVILYTIVSVFGNIGKAIGIVILVLSISGGGGNFPIEVSGQFFNDIYPYLPFTYAVKIMRETIAGVYNPTLIMCIKYLSYYLIGSVLFGLIASGRIRNGFEYFDKKSKESGLLH